MEKGGNKKWRERTIEMISWPVNLSISHSSPCLSHSSSVTALCVIQMEGISKLF